LEGGNLLFKVLIFRLESGDSVQERLNGSLYFFVN